MVNFWDVHGFWFIFFITLFPRLTLLLSSVLFGGLWWWLGWLVAPRLLISILATTAYWNTNTVFVVLSWALAFNIEYLEKIYIKKITYYIESR